MSALFTSILPVVESPAESSFVLLVDAPHLTIAYVENRFLGRVAKHPLALDVLAAVAAGHSLIIDEVIDPGWDELEITFRECGII